MSKYINAEKVHGKCSFCKSRYTCSEKRGSHWHCWHFDEKLAADVVEVVRCKDCNKSVCIGERYFCDIQYDEWGQPYVVKPDGFCDVGERRESE